MIGCGGKYRKSVSACARVCVRALGGGRAGGATTLPLQQRAPPPPAGSSSPLPPISALLPAEEELKRRIFPVWQPKNISGSDLRRKIPSQGLSAIRDAQSWGEEAASCDVIPCGHR